MLYRARGATLLLAALGALFTGAVLQTNPAVSQPVESHSVDIVAGWNLVGWLGPDTPVEDALGDIRPSVASVNTFAAATQTFNTFTTDGPDFLNTLDVIPAGAGVWLLATEALIWTQPGLLEPNGELGAAQIPNREVPLLPGFNLVAWTSDHQAPVIEALAGFSSRSPGALTSLFLWDALAETFLSFGLA